MLPPILPALLLLWVVRSSDPVKEPLRWVLGTFGLGALFGAVALFLEVKVLAWTDPLQAQNMLDGTSTPGGGTALVLLFALSAPVREASKVCAAWPAFRSKYFDEPYDGIVYSASAALGFAVIESGWVIRIHPGPGFWILRALLGLPANVFFACVWGYALGRVKQAKDPGPTFPVAWFAATVAHGLYAYLLYGRGESTVFATLPLLATMGIVAGIAARDLRGRGGALEGAEVIRMSAISIQRLPPVPSFEAVRKALRRTDKPLRFSFIAFGAFVTMGAMLLGFGAAVIAGHFAKLDFAAVSENDVSTAGPVALLSAGLLFAFPVSGFLLARAAKLTNVLEPALASALAIVVTLIALGVAAPVALLLGLSFSPIAWGLSCLGAWMGREAPGR